MFQRLFKEPGLVRRHCDAPLALERERYLQYLEEMGFKKFTVLKFARAMLLAVQELRTLPSEITTDEIRTAAGQKRRGKLSRRQSQFVYVTTQWCRFMGCLRESGVDSHPFVDLVGDFTNRLKVDQGLSPGTMTDSIYQFKFFIRRISPMIWRRVLVRSDESLSHLHQVIQVSLGWNDDHLYCFKIHGVTVPQERLRAMKMSLFRHSNCARTSVSFTNMTSRPCSTSGKWTCGLKSLYPPRQAYTIRIAWLETALDRQETAMALRNLSTNNRQSSKKRLHLQEEIEFRATRLARVQAKVGR